MRIDNLLSAMSLALWAAMSASAVAHPDIAASARLSFEMQERRLVAMSELLVFDKTTSQRLAARFDSNGDGGLSEAEHGNLGREVLGRLSEHAFFTELSLDGSDFALPDPEPGNLRFDGGLLQLRLTFRLHDPLDLRGRNLSVLLRDRDLVIAFGLEAAPPAISGGEADGCSARVEERSDQAYFGGLVTPNVVTLTCR
jgi:ABC-type uncharacterized transport system substrate-binding protein